MAKIARSAKGLKVDFDVLRIKEQIASAPKSTTVQAREDFIDKKFKRRLKRLTKEIIEQSKNPKPDVPVEAPVVAAEKQPVKKKLKTPIAPSKD
jgi:hypothetical protein